MRWRGRQESENVEDRRGMSAPKMAVGGGLGVIIVAVLAILMGKDPSQLLETLGQGTSVGAQQPGQPAERGPVDPAEEEMKQMLGVVLRDTEDVWSRLLGSSYVEPKMVIFSDAVTSACGNQTAQVGPFYCPADSSLYLDMDFFDDLARRHGAAGDFAQAYVIAHEVGHHVQNLLGVSRDVALRKRQLSKTEANEWSVRQELQADFFAGVWAHHADKMFDMLERGDVEEALNAASQIGDDTLQRKARGRVVPESFTHGTAEQRVRWFRRGLETGDPQQGDTYKVSYSEL